MATAFEQGRASMAIALPRRNTEQLCFIFSPITLIFSPLFRCNGFVKSLLSRILIIYIIYITLKVFFFSHGTVIYPSRLWSNTHDSWAQQRTWLVHRIALDTKFGYLLVTYTLRSSPTAVYRKQGLFYRRQGVNTESRPQSLNASAILI